MLVGYVQNAPIFGDKKRNFKRVDFLLTYIRADLIVLPELFATGYAITSKKELEFLAEEIGDDTTKFINELSRKIKGVVVGGFIEKDGEKFYNSAIISENGNFIGVYRKIHLYCKEKLWFIPGDSPPKVFITSKLKLGVMICFDWFFPETARTLALKGAELIAHPANLVLPYCQKAMITRCLENRVYAITANRIGQEKRGTDKFAFTGGSQIISPKGEVLASAPIDKTHVKVVEIDIKSARDKRINEYNDLFKDRRRDLYEL